MLVLTALSANSTPAQAGNGNDELKADPRLLQMAAENPDAVFMVIVQREVKNKDVQEDDPETDVEKDGGKVKKQMKMIESFSAELTGKQILKLAKKKKVRWISADAPMVSTAVGDPTVRDEFATATYSNNNGTQTWAGNWAETGDGSVSATSGYVKISSGQLRFSSTNRTLSRQANLSGVASATLTFQYKRSSFDGTSDYVAIQASANGGSTWTELARYKGAGSDSTWQTASFNILSYAAANTQIRFATSSSLGTSDILYVDNVQIEYALPVPTSTVTPSPYTSVVRADQLPSTLTGQGVTVAVIDSGITSFHPDFITGSSSRIIASEKLGYNLTTEDLYGHGTHMAGIIGGNGSASNGTYKGMAPDVNLINLKTSNEFGMTYESDVVNAMQWAYNNKDAYNIRVVNLSMNSTVAQSYHTSPLSAAVEILWFNGIVVVVSAGNNGTANGPSTLYPPANDPFVITVGASEDKGTASLSDDTMAVFSAYGTTSDGFAKPDLVAPGRNIVAPLGGLLNIVFQQHPLHRVNDYYFRMSGTSMSAPVVTGAVALLLQDEPNLTPDQVKYRLMSTANTTWSGYSASQSGAGTLDIYAAVNGTSTESANTGTIASQMLSTGSTPITWGSVGWNSVGWNSVGWNPSGWNSRRLEFRRLELSRLEHNHLGQVGEEITMKTQNLIRISGMLLLAATVSLVILALIYALQNPQVMVTLATVSWNG